MDQATVQHRLRIAFIGLESLTQALFIYGVMALLVGTTMTFTGAPQLTEIMFGSLSRAYLGMPLAIGGLFVTIGSFLGAERRWAWWAAILGMCIFAAWCLAMTITYVSAGLEQGFALAWPWNPIDTTPGPPKARAYVPCLFIGLMILAGIQVSAFARMGRPPKR